MKFSQSNYIRVEGGEEARERRLEESLKRENLLTKEKREWEKVEKGSQEDKEKKQKKMHRSEYQGLLTGGPMPRTPWMQRKGPRFDPWSRN